MSVIFYERSRNDVEVKWFSKFETVSYVVEDFDFNFELEGRKVKPPVHMGTVILWNNGPGAIKQEEVRIPFGLYVSDASFIGAKISKERSNVKNNFSLVQKDNGFEIHFRVLDPRMAVKVTFLVTSKDGIFGTMVPDVDFGPNSSVSPFFSPWWAKYTGAFLGLLAAFALVPLAFLLVRVFRTTFVQFSRGQVYFFVGIVVFFNALSRFSFMPRYFRRWTTNLVLLLHSSKLRMDREARTF